jgi:putative endonuclease
MIKNIGRDGELIAKDYLIEQEYQVLELNWRDQYKEVDIIAKKDNIIVFVEVKSRTTDYFGRPADAVNLRKQKLLIQAAETYIENHDISEESRFDIIEVIIDRNFHSINHIVDAFSGFSS